MKAPPTLPRKKPPPTPPKGERKDTHCGLDPQSHAAIVFLCSSLCFGREKKPRETMLHAPVRTNPTLQNCAAELASLKQSSHCLKAPFFNRRICCLPSRYRNHLRSKTIRLPHSGLRALIPASEPGSAPNKTRRRSRIKSGMRGKTRNEDACSQ